MEYTVDQEQSRKLLMHCHVYGLLALQTCLCSNIKVIVQSQNIAHLLLIWVHSVFSNTIICLYNMLIRSTTVIHCAHAIVIKSVT